MAREDWRGDPRDRDDFGQADYATDWAYDPEGGGPYRRFSQEDRSYDSAPAAERRYEEERRRRRRGPSDRVLWAVIVERLEDARRLDLRDVEVVVNEAEVTLNGTVRRKEDKRRIEDIADVEGVRNVQNNLRVRDRDRGWTFL